MATKRRNIFYENKKQETTEIAEILLRSSAIWLDLTRYLRHLLAWYRMGGCSIVLVFEMTLTKIVLFCCLLTARTAWAGEQGVRKAIVDVSVDTVLNNLNKHLADNVTLPDIQTSEISGRGVTFSNLKTWKRNGDSYVYVSGDGGLTTVADVSLRVMVLQVQDFTYKGQTGDTGFLIKDNSIRIQFTSHLKDSCDVRIEELKVTQLGGVLSCSDNPALHNRDFSEVFQKEMLPYANQQLDRDIIQKYIADNVVCPRG
ncbi:hypothetical protein AAG570_001865 [Ranatra chinensis]|uniref:Secreted protein n=1 Tax=Ranatra chinensis TaxID=642074 RepID=A0ABD0Y9R2_9HEMI